MARERRFEEAIQRFSTVIERDADRPEAIRHLAQAYGDSGRWEEAEKAWLRYLERCPRSADGFRSLGSLLKRMDKSPEAAKAYEQAIEIDSDKPSYHVDLGLVLVQAKRQEEAKNAFLRALQIDADFYDAHINLGMLLQEMRQSNTSLMHLRKAVELRPDDPSGQNNLGVVLSEQGKLDEAIECYTKLLERVPTFALAWNNLGNALRSSRRHEEAFASLQKALELKPDYTEAYNNLGIICTQMERFPDALAAFDRALFLRPDYPEAHANRGLVYLLLGDFQRGWSDYEWRWQGKNGLKRRKYAGKPWDGSPLAGKRILLYFEQGLGDTFQFIRYARELKARGATVIFECQRNTREILSRTPGIDELVVRGEKPPACHFYAPVLGLPGLCQTDLQNLPRRIPYIFTDPAIAWEWKQRLAKMPGLKVGIVWQGNPEHKGDKNRSIPLTTFEPLAKVPGVTLVSLQKNFGVEQIAGLQGRFSLTDFGGISENCDGFIRTAAIIASLDLVISADTSVAHLAGAMGVPVWVALQTSPDWRWLLEREDTPWYPTMRLFRQQEPGNWEEVFARITNALAERVSVSTRHSCEISGLTNQMEAQRLLREAGEYLRRNKLDAARQLLEQAVVLDPTNVGVHQDLGVAYAKASRYADAIASFRRGLEIVPDSPELYGNLGLACYHSGRAGEAVQHLRQAIFLGAGSADVHKNLARALAATGEVSAEEEAYWAALRLQPDDIEAHYHLAIALLRQGKFEQGWLEYEWRWRWFKWSRRQSSRPRWVGQNIAGKRILLRSEKDTRDTIQFARYASLIEQRGGRTCLECDPSLSEVMAGCVGIERIISVGDPLPAHDFQADLPSLSTIFATALQTVPAVKPYLGVKHEVVEYWRDQLKTAGRIKIGLALPNHPDRDFRESVKLLLKTDWPSELTFYDLASEDRGEGASYAPLPIVQLYGLPRGGSSGYYSSVAGVIRNMSLVIAGDNNIAHLAGAMGVPTCVMLPSMCHHRWLIDRQDSPWYPTMRLVRQSQHRDWTEAVNRLLNQGGGRAS
ncbi:MAG: tetratricopeptide repeat protein [Tepidisphaeraceae bacterium]